MMSYPQHSTQPRENPFWKRGNFVHANANFGSFSFFQPEHDFQYAGGGTGGSSGTLLSRFDVTNFTVCKFESRIVSGSGTRNLRVDVGTALFSTNGAIHDWTWRVFDITSRTGVVNVLMQASFNNGNIDAAIRNFEIY